MLERGAWVPGSALWKIACAELPAYLMQQRWFPGKDAGIPELSVESVFPLRVVGYSAAVIVWQVRPADRVPFRLCMPLAIVGDASTVPDAAIVARLPGSADRLVDATAVDSFVRVLVQSIIAPVPHPAGDLMDPEAGRLTLSRTDAIGATELTTASADSWIIKRSRVEQSNTSIRVGRGAILKLIRKLESGIHPELEMGRHLTERAHFASTPALLGWIDSGDTTLAILQAFVVNDGDGLTWLLDRLRSDPTAAGLGWLHRLGERTGELHLALAADTDDPAFAPEDIAPADWHAWRQGVLALSQRAAQGLEDASGQIDDDARAAARDYLTRIQHLDVLLSELLPADGTLKKTRHHGDYHLGQVLVHHDDAVIVDFEGEPMRPLAERRSKHCALRDVAGMLRSLGYAAAVAGLAGDAWLDAATQAYLRGYFLRVQSSPGCPHDRDTALRLVRFFTIEKALYEISYELANRPGWVGIPLRAVNRLLDAAGALRGDVIA